MLTSNGLGEAYLAQGEVVRKHCRLSDWVEPSTPEVSPFAENLGADA